MPMSFPPFDNACIDKTTITTLASITLAVLPHSGDNVRVHDDYYNGLLLYFRNFIDVIR